MKYLIINLRRSVDRRLHVEKEFNSTGGEYEIFIGKDQFELTQQDYEVYADLNSKSINWNPPFVPGLLACWISHQSAWKQCLENDRLDLVAIFEDDAIISERFNSAIDALESKKHLFDIVFLNNSRPDKTFKGLVNIDEDFVLGTVKYQNIGALGYLINRVAMQRLIDWFPRFQDLLIDEVLHRPWLTNLRAYTLDPPVVSHRIGHESLIWVQGRLSQSLDATTVSCSESWESLGKLKKWKTSYAKRVWYFQNTIFKGKIK